VGTSWGLAVTSTAWLGGVTTVALLAFSFPKAWDRFTTCLGPIALQQKDMFYSVDVGYDLCGPPITTPGTVLLHHRRNYVIRVTDGKSEGGDKGGDGEGQGEEDVTVPEATSATAAADTNRPPPWKVVSTDDKNVAKFALVGPAGESFPGKVFFQFPWSKQLIDAISTGMAPSDGGEAVAIEGTLDQAVHRAALVILKKGRQGNFSVNIFGHEELPTGISLETTLTMEEAEDMQSDDSHYVEARVMVNNMTLILFQQPQDGEDEEKVLRRRILKYTWWEEALPKGYAMYKIRKVQGTCK
jgi:hypothetical protein